MNTYLHIKGSSVFCSLPSSIPAVFVSLFITHLFAESEKLNPPWLTGSPFPMEHCDTQFVVCVFGVFGALLILNGCCG